MKKIWTILILVMCVTFVTACAEAKILERISLATLIGYDSNEDRVTSTAVIREVTPEFKSKVEIQSETELTSKGTRVKINMKTSKKIMAGQIRVVLFGEELAKGNGLEELLHTLKMNSEISNSIYLAVVDGDAKSLLEYQFKEIDDIGQHVFNLLDHNINQQSSISSTLHEVVRDLYSPLRNIAMPIVKRDGEFIEISGVALFSNEKMVGELPAGDIFYIMMMRDNFKYGTLELEIPNFTEDSPKQLPLAIDSIQSKRHIKVIDKDTPEFELRIELDCRLLEIHSRINSGDPKLVNKLEKELNKKIKSELERIISYSQKSKSDIFGFGENYYGQIRNSNIDQEEWYEMYDKMKVNIIIDTQIIRNGVFE